MAIRKNTILAVDDDPRLRRMMTRMLELENFRVLAAESGEEALTVFENEKPDLVLLDLMMPGMGGYEACKRIREFSQVPVIMLTGKAQPEDRIKGFDAGADDYVTKPFSSTELMARVRAVLRRVSSSLEDAKTGFQAGDLKVDFIRHAVSVDGREVLLTATEYAVIFYLARNAGMVLTPDQILSKVWGEGYTGETHLLQVHMARLRDKLGEDPKNPRYITTRHGIGYMMAREIANS